MKKLLLTTTALALSMGVSSAYAMGNAEISLSGSSKWTYNDADDGENTGGGNNNSFAISNSVTVDSSIASDSGLTYGTSLTLLSGATNDVTDDGMKLFVKGPFGEIRTGGGGAGDSYGISTKGLVEGEDTNVGGSNTAVAKDDSISYFTPSINGIEAALSYTDAGEASKGDTSEIGIKFTTDLSIGALTLQYARATTAANGSDNASKATESSAATSFGGKLALGGITLVVASHSKESNGLDNETESIGYGLSYQLNDELKIGLYSRDGEDGDDDVAETAASLTYTVAPGLTTNLAYTTSEVGDDDDTSTTSAYIKVAF